MSLAKKLKFFFSSLAFLGLILAGGLYYVLQASLPLENGQQPLPGLSAMATVDADKLGVPAIHAANREDVFRVLGFLHARDRLFQMELMRRKSAGRLAEIFGDKAVSIDKTQRDYQLEQTAANIVSALPAGQKSVLAAYVAGVNAFLSLAKVLPPEFIVLNLRPETWRAEDSILVALGMFQTLNGQEQDERMLSVMEQALPLPLVKFLTPDTDAYATVLVGGSGSRRPEQAIPVSAFHALGSPDIALTKGAVAMESAIAGSNNWVVGGKKTADGRAIIANDMHLKFSAPNIWYRAEYQYADRSFSGVTLPGVPLPIVGGNQHVAWGFTNATADLLDLISLEINPENDQEYLTPAGWRKFTISSESIQVKGGEAIPVQLRTTIWGPVSAQALLGRQIAIKWTALETQAVDLGLLDMDSVTSTQQALTVIGRIGGPPQNVVFADSNGHIAWTYMGKFPKRQGFDGSVSKSWANAAITWDGFIPAAEMPSLFDPPAGYIATANNRTLGSDYPYALGFNWALGYRAYRIDELLRQKPALTEQDMLQIQLDTRSEMFEFYRVLALEALSHAKDRKPEQASLESALRAWDGHMQSESKGIALLISFRAKLAEGLFAKVVAQCQKFEPKFNYAWREMETPLRALLTQRPPGVVPVAHHEDWDDFILQALKSAADDLVSQHPNIPLQQLNWATVNQISLPHPLSKGLPLLESILNINDFASDGCAGFCVKVVSNAHGASERMVISPAYPEDGILEMPGGQSGQPFSRHYRDQQAAWQLGEHAAFLPGDIVNTLHFKP
jgi:penicillin amidase